MSRFPIVLRVFICLALLPAIVTQIGAAATDLASQADDPLLAASVAEKSVQLLGYDINYIDEGNSDEGAEILVFLHNGGGFWQIWVHQVRFFAPQYRVVAFDFPGFGASSGVDDSVPLSLDLTTDVVAAFVEALELDRFVLVGNCIGGSTALRYQNLHPDRVRGMVVMNLCPGERIVPAPLRWLVFGLPEGGFLRKVLGSILTFVSNLPIVMRLYFPSVLFGEETSDDDPLWQKVRRFCELTRYSHNHSFKKKYVENYKEEKVEASRINLLFAVGSYTLEDFLVPNGFTRSSLLIWGSSNRVAPLETEGFYHKEVGQFDRMEIVSSAGHLTMYEAPDLVNELILESISNLPPS